MMTVWSSPTVPATSSTDPARITVSQHNSRREGFCTHLEVLPIDGRPQFKVSGNYDMTIDDAMVDAANRYHALV